VRKLKRITSCCVFCKHVVGRLGVILFAIHFLLNSFWAPLGRSARHQQPLKIIMARTNTPTALHEQENFLPQKQLVLVIITLGTVLFVINIDHNGLPVLLPTIAEDLDAQKSIIWAGSSALIATTVFSVLYGRLSDIFGRKILFVSALGVFAIAELGCGFAINPQMLYALRALTGASGGGIGNLSIIVATDVVSLRQRGQYMAIVAPFMVLGNVCGPLIAAGFVKR
jgi:MFS family permease